MTYAVNSTILAADYMAFRGSNAPNVAYADAVAASDMLAALIGVGYGTRGYGQTSTVLPAVSTGSSVTASQWNSLISVISNLNTHTGSGLVVPTAVAVGDVIQAFDGTDSRPNIHTLIPALDANRMNAAIGQMAQTASGASSQRTTSWNTMVYHEWTVTFSSEDDARYFFNTGGQIQVEADRSGGTASTLNSAITDMLNDIGTIKFSAQTTTSTPPGSGTAYPIGYYGLTGAYQTLFVHLGITYGYSSISYTLNARAENIVGTNGGNGTVIRFQAIFETGLPSYDTADGTLDSSVFQLKAGGVLLVTAPTYAVTHALSL
jgi:hypothetical protein